MWVAGKRPWKKCVELIETTSTVINLMKSGRLLWPLSACLRVCWQKWVHLSCRIWLDKKKKGKTIKIQISKWVKNWLLSIRNLLEEGHYRAQQWKLEINVNKIHLPVTLPRSSIYSSGNLPSSIIKILIDISLSKAQDDDTLKSYEMPLNNGVN